MVVTLSRPQCIIGEIDRKTGQNHNKAQQGVYCAYDMMVTSCHGNALRFTGRLWGESTGISQKTRKSDSCISFLVAWTSCSMDCRCGGDLTNWGRVTHICVNKLTVIGSDNGLSPGRRQAIIWTNAGILLIGPFQENAFESVVWKTAAILSRPQWVNSFRPSGPVNCAVTGSDNVLSPDLRQVIIWANAGLVLIVNKNKIGNILCKMTVILSRPCDVAVVIRMVCCKNLYQLISCKLRSRSIRWWDLTLQWRHNGCHGISNHQQLDGLFNYLLKLIFKKKTRYGAHVRGIHRSPVDSPHKWPVTLKVLPLRDVIMEINC